MGVIVSRYGTQWISALIGLTLIDIGFPTAHASDLSLYEATYTTKVIGIKVTLNRTLTQEGDQYHLSQAGKTFLLTLNENSHFSLNGDQIVGEHFVYQLGGVSNRRREVLFDQQKGIIHSLKKGEWTEHPWSPHVLDRLSQQEQMRLQLLRSATPPERISLSIIDGRRIKLKHFDLVETATLDTSVGILNTVHYTLHYDHPSERSSNAWLAVDHDFLIVRTEHVEDGLRTVIQLQGATMEGQPVKGI